MTTYFFDTYALYETITETPIYLEYAKNVKMVTTRMNLMELYFSLLKKYPANMIEAYYALLLKFCVAIDDEVIKKACLFRHANRSKGFSYIDCLGYVIARTMNMTFLTGDRAFKGMDGVEFVK